MKSYYLATDHRNTSCFFVTRLDDIVDTAEEDPDIKYRVIVDGFYVGSLIYMRQAALEKFKKARENPVPLCKLSKFVAEKEAELAYGSETCILTGFVNEFGHVAEAMESRSLIHAETLEAYKEAYAKLERFTDQGVTDFNVSDLF